MKNAYFHGKISQFNHKLKLFKSQKSQIISQIKFLTTMKELSVEICWQAKNFTFFSLMKMNGENNDFAT